MLREVTASALLYRKAQASCPPQVGSACRTPMHAESLCRTSERYPGMVQDEVGIWIAPTGAKVAWFKDPEGNLLSISEHPEVAV